MAQVKCLFFLIALHANTAICWKGEMTRMKEKYQQCLHLTRVWQYNTNETPISSSMVDKRHWE